MPQSLANVLLHIVFSTKERRALLQVADLRDEMHRYLAGVSAKLNCPAIIVGGATDHVHCSFVGQPIADDRIVRMGERIEAGVVDLGEREKPTMGIVSMAGGLRGVFRESVAKRTGAKVYRFTRGTSSTGVVSR
jgi:hypothetical protein